MLFLHLKSVKPLIAGKKFAQPILKTGHPLFLPFKVHEFN